MFFHDIFCNTYNKPGSESVTTRHAVEH